MLKIFNFFALVILLCSGNAIASSPKDEDSFGGVKVLEDMVYVNSNKPFFIEIFEATKDGYRNPARMGSYEEAKNYCRSKGMRVPSKKEWLIAGSNDGRNIKYTLAGDQIKDRKGNKLAHFDGHPSKLVHDFSSLGIDAIGTVGMTGNRAEWVRPVNREPTQCGGKYTMRSTRDFELDSICRKDSDEATVRCVLDYKESINYKMKYSNYVYGDLESFIKNRPAPKFYKNSYPNLESICKNKENVFWIVKKENSTYADSVKFNSWKPEDSNTKLNQGVYHFVKIDIEGQSIYYDCTEFTGINYIHIPEPIIVNEEIEVPKTDTSEDSENKNGEKSELEEPVEKKIIEKIIEYDQKSEPEKIATLKIEKEEFKRWNRSNRFVIKSTSHPYKNLNYDIEPLEESLRARSRSKYNNRDVPNLEFNMGIYEDSPLKRILGPSAHQYYLKLIDNKYYQEAIWLLEEYGFTDLSNELKKTLFDILTQESVYRSGPFSKNKNITDVKIWTLTSGIKGLFKLNPPTKREDIDAEVAAYKIDQLLGLSIVPMTVFRNDSNGKKGSFQYYVNNVVGTGRDVRAGRSNTLTFFDHLIHNYDRHSNNFLFINWVGNVKRMIAVDHNLAFVSSYKSNPPKNLYRIPSRELFEKLKGLTNYKIDFHLSDDLSRGQRSLMKKQRDHLIEMCNNLIRQHGDEAFEN